MTDPVLDIQRDGSLLQLTLNRPRQANALDAQLTEALLDALADSDDVRLCVIRGAGRHFCAGFDLADLDDSSDADLLWRFLRIETLLQAVQHAPFAVVALAQGKAIGAGADLFAACWQRVAAPDAGFRMPGWNFELALGTRRLTRLVGTDAARDLLIDSRLLDARQALDCGLASDVCDTENWPGRIDALHRRAATLPVRALADMLALTAEDSRDADLAAVVRSAGRPGLKARIQAYRDRLGGRDDGAGNQSGSAIA